MSVLLGRMYAAGGRPAVVLDPANRLAGIVTLDDVDRAERRGRRPAAVLRVDAPDDGLHERLDSGKLPAIL